jgi:hypothetical protein
MQHMTGHQAWGMFDPLCSFSTNAVMATAVLLALHQCGLRFKCYWRQNFQFAGFCLITVTLNAQRDGSFMPGVVLLLEHSVMSVPVTLHDQHLLDILTLENNADNCLALLEAGPQS